MVYNDDTSECYTMQEHQEPKSIRPPLLCNWSACFLYIFGDVNNLQTCADMYIHFVSPCPLSDRRCWLGPAGDSGKTKTTKRKQRLGSAAIPGRNPQPPTSIFNNQITLMVQESYVCLGNTSLTNPDWNVWNQTLTDSPMNPRHTDI